MNAAELVTRLEGVRERGPGKWSARCPAHEDRGPSLSVLETEDRVLMHCFAGCYPADICSALGISLRDLFRDDVRRRRNDEVDDEMKRRMEHGSRKRAPAERAEALPAHSAPIAAFSF